MIKRIAVILFFCFSGWAVAVAQETCNCPAQSKPGKGTFYFSFGYNLDWYTTSDINFKDKKTGNYDFTIYDVKAEDRPGLRDILHQDITIPQYSFRFGYYFNDKHDLGIELNYDHAKYVVIDYQRVRMKGMINDVYYDQDTTLTPYWLNYEHSNGANFCLVNLLKRETLLHTANKKHWLSIIAKPGIGFVFPRSDITIFGTNRNDTYHVAGYIAGLELAMRYDFFRYFFIETSGKGVFANYNKVYLPKKGIAKQKFFGFEYILTAGLQVPL